MGFCYFSNIAVAALDAVENGAKRVAISGTRKTARIKSDAIAATVQTATLVRLRCAAFPL